MNTLVLSKKARLYPKAKASGFSLETLDNEGNTLDFNANKHNLEQEEFTPNVTTITKLSEILTLFES